MPNKPDAGLSRFDAAKTLAAVSVIVGGLAAFYYFSDALLVVRVVGLVACIVIAGFIASQTSYGQDFVEFVHDARAELRKVVWPTRAETTQTGIAVIAMVIVMGIFLWLLDQLLFWLVRLLTT